MATKATRKHRAALKPATRGVEYVDNPELRRRGRAERLLAAAEAMLAGPAAVTRADEETLFKAFHACGYALHRLVRGRAAGRSARQLRMLRQRLVTELVNRNMGLIYDMRRRTRVAGVDVDDLMSEGLWTLYRAVVSFDPWRGFRFSTYACTSILRGFLMLTRRRQRQQDQIARLGEAQSVVSPPREGPDLRTQLRLDRLQWLLADNRAGLTPTERFVIERRLMHDPGVKAETLESIGEMFELSKERIRQIQVSAIDKLRGALLDVESGAAAGGAVGEDDVLAGDLIGLPGGAAWSADVGEGLAAAEPPVALATPVGDGPAAKPATRSGASRVRKAG